MNQTRIIASKKGLSFALCMLSYLLGGSVSTMMSVYLPVALPDLLHKNLSEHDLSEIGAYINAIFLYGWMLGGLVIGFVSDKIGRISTLAMATGICGLATVLVVFVDNWYVLLALRFFAGIGVGGILLISTVYIAEIWPEKTRPIFLGILAVSFPIGIVLTGGITLLFTNWHDAFWIGLLPVLLAILIFLLLPESLAWRNIQKTKRPIHQPVFTQHNRANLVVGILIFGSVLIGLWGIFSWLPTWVQGLLVDGEKGQKERGAIMMILGIGGIVGGFLSGFLIKSWGFKTTLMLTFLGCSGACMLLFLTNTAFSPIIYVETALLSLFFGISQGTLSSFIPALFPTEIRGSASGLCFNIGRFFTATAVFFVGNLVAILGGLSNSLLVFSITFIVAFVIVLRGKTHYTSA
jgi:MFS family permease